MLVLALRRGRPLGSVDGPLVVEAVEDAQAEGGIPEDLLVERTVVS